MAGTRRSRTLPASPEQLWELIADPHHMPRWWPGVERMEGVEPDRFTQVFKTKRGRPVRADFRVVASEAPRTRAWEQEVDGTPFERVLSASVIEIQLGPGSRRHPGHDLPAAEAAWLLAHRRVPRTPRDRVQARRGTGRAGPDLPLSRRRSRYSPVRAP